MLRDLPIGWIGPYISVTFGVASLFLLASIPGLFELSKQVLQRRGVDWTLVACLIVLSGLATYAKLHVGLAMIVVLTAIVVFAQKNLRRFLTIGIAATLFALMGVWAIIGDTLFAILSDFATLNFTMIFPIAVVVYIAPVVAIVWYLNPWAGPGLTTADQDPLRLVAKALLALLAVTIAIVMTRSANNANAHWIGVSLNIYSIFLLVPLIAHSQAYPYLRRFLVFRIPRGLHGLVVFAAQYLAIMIYLFVVWGLAATQYSYLSRASREMAAGKARAAMDVIKAVDAEKRVTGAPLLVYVPPESGSYWALVDKCQSKAFLIPALTGVPMLKGIPPSSIGCDDYLQNYSYNYYGPESRSQPLDKSRACDSAIGKGFARILVIREPLLADTHDLWDCAAKSSDPATG